jgi:hypothetical protein
MRLIHNHIQHVLLEFHACLNKRGRGGKEKMQNEEDCKGPNKSLGGSRKMDITREANVHLRRNTCSYGGHNFLLSH